MQRNFLSELVESAEKRVASGYYDLNDLPISSSSKRSLSSALKNKYMPVIAEVKFASPSQGLISDQDDVCSIARAYERGGAAAISVLTEPDYFRGSIYNIRSVKEAVRIPVLMKDIFVSIKQIHAAGKVGADAVLLIAGIFRENLSRNDLYSMITTSHKFGMEVLIEVHDEEELNMAEETEADVIGINNRNLKTLEVSLETSTRLLGKRKSTKPVVCESGFEDPSQIFSLKRMGADGFLIGTALMKSQDKEATLKRFTSGGIKVEG